jgi:hypothetical protein
MKTAVGVVQNLIRLIWLILLALGIILWTGRQALMLVHEWLGAAFVLALWELVYLAVRSGAAPEPKNRGLTMELSVWSLILLALGLAQTSILSGPSHWIIRVLHLLVGLIAMGLAEALGTRIRRHLARSV